MRKVSGLIVWCAMVFCACQAPPVGDIAQAEWLIGTWESKTPEGTVYESWRRTGEKEFSGTSYFINDKDTVVLESIRLVGKQDGLFYIPTVSDQNGGLPVTFACVDMSATEIVFENRKHDFPQVISYMKTGPDSLLAQISGTVNGQEKSQAYPMKRLN